MRLQRLGAYIVTGFLDLKSRFAVVRGAVIGIVSKGNTIQIRATTRQNDIVG